MKKTMSITIAILLTLSIISVAMPAMFAANAGSVGNITASDSNVTGNRVIQITITDADIAAVDADMPSVTADTTIRVDADRDATASFERAQTNLPMYQITGGSWVGFITQATTKPVIANASFPVQQALGPGGIPTATAGTSDNVIGDGISAEPNIRFTGAAMFYNDTIVQISSVIPITLTYHDSDPSGDVSVTIGTDTATGTITVRDRTAIPPGATLRIQVEDMDLNLNPLAADVYSINTTLTSFTAGTNNQTYVDGDASTTYTTGEAIVNDTGPLPNGDGFYTAGEAVVGTTPAVGTPLVTFAASEMFADADADGLYGSGEAIVSDTDASTSYNPGDLLTTAGTGLIAANIVGIGFGTYGTSVTNRTGEPDGFPTLTESAANSGIFRGQLTVDTGTAPPTRVLSIDYSDAAGISGVAGTERTSAAITTTWGLVSVDKTTYVISDVMSISVTDPDMNLNPSGYDFTAATPAVGTVLTGFSTTGASDNRYIDTDASGTYTAGESIYLDVVIGTVSAADTLIAGTAVAVGTATVAFVATETFIDNDANGLYTQGEAIITDTDVSLTWTAGDAVLMAGSGSITNSVTATSTSDPDFGFLIVLTETGTNTGVYSEITFFSFGAGISTSPVLNVASFDIISVSYLDAATGTSAAGYNHITTATFDTNTGTMSLDQTTYDDIWGTATLTIVDPDLNTNSLTIQAINPNP